MKINLQALALETAGIVEQGGYGEIRIEAELAAARKGTRLYRPAEEAQLSWPSAAKSGLRLSVTPESSLAAARRLVVELGRTDTAVLNFASARNPGGGWLGGARAQEESLARASGLVRCLEAAPEYYAANRAERSCLYTDHLIYSPGVPVFRDESGTLLARPYLATFLTSPAPNQGAIERNTPDQLAQVRPTLERRARQVLKVAAANGHRTLVLGAWGCGAFRCESAMVAQVFQNLFGETEIRSSFEEVVFAILGGRPGQSTFETFQGLLGSPE
jgi:uncharacterized protein (TIGR02452 family)